MEIEIIQPLPLPPSSPEFSFDSSTSTPYITAPSSPQRFGVAASSFSTHSCSSPPAATAYAVDLSRTSFSINPALWEEDNPGLSSNTPNSPSDFIDLDDFEFEFGGSRSDRFKSSPSPADELFDHGRIKPLATVAPPQEQSSKAEPSILSTTTTTRDAPKRVCDILTEEDEGEDEERLIAPAAGAASNLTSSSRTFSSLLSSITNPKGYRKWSFRDFLLFRSASEGRGTSKDPLRKFQALGAKIGRSESFGDSMRVSSFRTNVAGVGEESSGRRQRISKGPHEVYYSANKAVAEEMKRRTALPYKQGLLGGCLGFNPNPGAHDLARGVGSISRG